ncbi:MAG TPA: FliA/WhiG family RNA polymerase sigma factor [Sphingobacteriaceae bacterium]|nr:FliA/WhiG family RNA polymerase sigma factor [Sphingobacteriaceae bacterium]
MGAQQPASPGGGAVAVEAGPSLEQLWLNYKHKQDEAARQELISRHLHLVKYIASRMVVHLPPMVELDDLISYGVFGLLDAIEKFDYRRGVKFETYAYTRIKGAVLDGLRAMDWVPQSLRKQAKEVEAAYWQLYHQDGRPPTDEQVAQSLGMSQEEYSELSQRLSSTTVLSLEDVLGSGDDGDGSISLRDLLADPESPDPLAAVQLSEAKDRLAAAIAALPERDQLIISLYYYEGLTVKEIAEILELSASRISQIHTRAIMRLRAHMQAGKDGP